MSKHFGNVLLKILTEKKITQAELARETGLTQACISQYVNGEREPVVSNMLKLLQVLNVDIKEFQKPHTPILDFIKKQLDIEKLNFLEARESRDCHKLSHSEGASKAYNNILKVIGKDETEGDL